MTDEVETGANHIIESLHRTLSVNPRKGKLPDVLYLHVDKFTKENKNRYMFWYLESLIARDVSQKSLPPSCRSAILMPT